MYTQCHGCRQPLTKQELKSQYYKKGVSCSYCYTNRTKEQQVRSLTRQKQIDLAENNNKKHPFKKITFTNYS